MISLRVSCVLIVLAFTFSSCGQIKKAIQKKKEVKAPVQKLNFGPTLSKQSHFKDVTSQYGLEGVRSIHTYAVDFDNDGDTDLVFLPDFYSVPEFYKFDQDKRRFYKLQKSPFGQKIRTSFLNFADINRDGVLDVLAVTMNQKSAFRKRPIRLFYGRVVNGVVHYAEEEILKKSYPTAGLSVIDYNLDGELDLFVANWFSKDKKTPTPERDLLLEQVKGKFLDATSLLPTEKVKESSGGLFKNIRPSYSVSTCDIDQNGWPDFLVTSTSGYSNKLWMNYQEIFRDFGVESGYAHDFAGEELSLGGGNTHFSSCADFNNDGIMDVVVGELFHYYDSETRDRSAILTGDVSKNHPRFLRTEFFLDDNTTSWDEADRRAIWMDYNNDGLEDLIVENSGFPPKSRLVLFEQYSDHAYENQAKNLGVDVVNPSGTVVLDFNQDGKIDLLTGQTNVRESRISPRVYLFENVVPDNGSTRLSIKLRGEKSNLQGLGAMILVKTNKTTRRRWVEYNHGSLPSQNEDLSFVSIPKDEKLLSITVRWPYYSKSKKTLLKRIYRFKKPIKKRSVRITLHETGKMEIQ